MASIQVSIRYKGMETAEDISIGTEVEESIRRVQMKRGANVVDEVSYQLANEVILKMTDQRTIRNLICSIVKRLRDENKVEKEI